MPDRPLTHAELTATLDAIDNAALARDEQQLRAQECADGDCPHARHARRIAEVAGEYRYGVEEALDYIEDRDGITPKVAETLRGILTRAIEKPIPTA